MQFSQDYKKVPCKKRCSGNNNMLGRHAEKLKEKNVKLLITTVHASEMVVHICSTMNIKVVHCVDEDEMMFLSRVSNVSVIHESEEVLTGEICQYVGHADSCQNIVVAGKRHIQLTNPKFYGPQNDGMPSWQQCRSNKLCPLHIVQSVLVCALTPGMCSQFASVMYNAIRCLRMWTDPGNILNPAHNMESHISVDSDTEANTTDKSGHITGYSICGGGAFELCLYRSLRNHMKSCHDAELQEVLKILSDSLLAVPLRLLQNSYATAAKRMNVAQLLKCVSPMINDALDPSLERIPKGCTHGASNKNRIDHGNHCSLREPSASLRKSEEAGDTLPQHSIVGIDGKTGTSLLPAGCGCSTATCQ